MIGIVNMPCESPSVYYASPPRNASDIPIFNDVRPRQTARIIYTPDGKRVTPLRQQDVKPLGAWNEFQSQSTESLWSGAIKRTIVYQLGRDQLKRKAVSCCNFSHSVDNLHLPSQQKCEQMQWLSRKQSVGNVNCADAEQKPCKRNVTQNPPQAEVVDVAAEDGPQR